MNQKQLVGIWEGGAEDGSGLRTLIYNYGVVFNKDGRGISYAWNNENEEMEELEIPFEWTLIGKNVLRVRNCSESGSDNDWLQMEIEISDFIGAYEAPFFKLTESGKETFWNFPEPLYKVKMKGPKKSFIKRFWRR